MLFLDRMLFHSRQQKFNGNRPDKTSRDRVAQIEAGDIMEVFRQSLETAAEMALATARRVDGD